MEKKEWVKLGKRNRANGAIFEKRTRDDLESKGWIVSKYGNNIKAECVKCGNKLSMNTNKNKYFCKTCKDFVEFKLTKQIPASPGRFRMMQTGFPDFIAFKQVLFKEEINHTTTDSGFRRCGFQIFGIECKTNGKLSQIEKAKCKWYLEHNVFSKILIASKYKEKGRVKIRYEEFK